MKLTIKKVFSFAKLTGEKGIIFVFFLTIISSLLETLSVGLVVPIFAAIMDQNFLTSFPTMGILAKKFFPESWFLNESQLIFSKKQIVITSAIIVLIVYTLKTFVSLGIFWLIQLYIGSIRLQLNDKFFKGYLKLPYIYHLKVNSAEMHNNFLRLNDIGTALEQLFIIFAECLIAIALISLLIYSDIYSALAIIILFPAFSFLIVKFTKKNLVSWAKRKHIHVFNRIKYISDVFKSIKEIKILGKSNRFTDNFSHHTSEHVTITRHEKIIQTTPRYGFELLFVLSLFVIIFFLVLQNKPETQIIPTLALFAVASFRLLPSVNRIINGFQNLRALSPIIDILHKAFQKILNVKTNKFFKEKFKFNRNISFENVEFSYDKTSKKILQNINLNISKGSSVCLVGKSGSGKTTFVDLIIGLIFPTKGIIKIDDQDISGDVSRNWQDLIGYVPQDVYISDDSIRNNIAYGVKENEISDIKILEAIKSANLSEFLDEQPEKLDALLGENGCRISGGQKQRIGIARALYHKPEVLILDEATSSLDLETEKKIIQEIYQFKGKKIIIVVTHRTTNLDKFDKVIKIENGKIFSQQNHKGILN